MRRFAVPMALVLLALPACSGSSKPDAKARATTTTAAPRLDTAGVRAMLAAIQTKIDTLPRSYNGNQFPGGGDQAKVAAKWSLGAEDFHNLADGLRDGDYGTVTPGVLVAARAVDSLAATVTAMSKCLTTDDANFNGTRVVGVHACPAVGKQFDARVRGVGAAFGSLRRS